MKTQYHPLAHCGHSSTDTVLWRNGIRTQHALSKKMYTAKLEHSQRIIGVGITGAVRTTFSLAINIGKRIEGLVKNLTLKIYI